MKNYTRFSKNRYNKKETKQRDRNLRLFELLYLPYILTLHKVFKGTNNNFTIYTSRFGSVEYYPKGGKLLVKKSCTWITDGLDWIDRNIMQNVKEFN